MSLIRNISLADGAQLDAFNRLRVSLPFAQFDYSNQYDKSPLLWSEQVVGTGVGTFVANTASVTLSTGGTASGAGIGRQTFEYFRYRPGRSQLVLMTFCLPTPVANVTARLGYFDVNNGIYFEMLGNTAYNMVIRTFTGGSPSNTVVARASWNLDKLDGTGPSQINLDFTKTQILAIDFEWLGVGRVRCGFVHNGSIVYAHQFLNDNLITTPYMTTADLPLRYEIFNTALAGGTTTMSQICSTVMSEGADEVELAYTHSANTAETPVSPGSTLTPILAIRPKATFNSLIVRAKIVVNNYQIVTTSASGTVLWQLLYFPPSATNPFSTSPSFTSVGANSSVEYAIGMTGVNGSAVYEVVDSGYVSSSGSPPALSGLPITSRYPLTWDYSGAIAFPANFVLAVIAAAGSPAAVGAMTFQEVR